MIKRLCCTTKMAKYWKYVTETYVKKHVSLNNDPNWRGWSFVFYLFFAYIRYDAFIVRTPHPPPLFKEGAPGGGYSEKLKKGGGSKVNLFVKGLKD